MINQNYILFIDYSPVEEELKRYFEKNNLKIVQKTCLFSITDENNIPFAILIHWSILKKHQFFIDTLNSYLIPIIVLDDEINEALCIFLLESGIHDFLIKPLHPPKLYARITAINRRLQANKQSIEPEKQVIKFKEWCLYPASRQLFKNEQEEIHLSSGEYELLYAFVQQARQVLDREFLSKLSKDCNLEPFDRRIDVQISRLRQKIEKDIKNPDLIKTVRNRGYIFTAEILQE